MHLSLKLSDSIVLPLEFKAFEEGIDWSSNAIAITYHVRADTGDITIVYEFSWQAQTHFKKSLEIGAK